MEKVIIFVLAACLVALFFSRIHFHFSFNLSISKSSAKSGGNAGCRLRPNGGDRSRKVRRASLNSRGDGGVPVVRSIEAVGNVQEAELISALVNLGCPRQKSQELAKEAIGKGSDFDSRIKWALQNAA